MEYGWPWGSNHPTRTQRLIVASVVATVAAALILNGYALAPPGFHADIGEVLFGARQLLHHVDPYPLVGPGRPFDFEFPLLYPVTAMVTLMPLALLPENLAVGAFVWISTAVLVYGMTRKSWHLLPILPSISFLVNVRTGQWTILATAMLFVPAAAFFALAKPQLSFPVVATSRKTWLSAAIGGSVLLVASFAFLPSWPVEWFEVIRAHSAHLHPPLTRPLGFLIPLVLLRWRRSESWFVLLLACMPQTWDYYNTLPLLALAATYREACVLSLVSSLGGFVWMWVGHSVARTAPELSLYGGAVIVAFAYLPVVAAILRRPNVGLEVHPKAAQAPESVPAVWLLRARNRILALRPSVD